LLHLADELVHLRDEVLRVDHRGRVAGPLDHELRGAAAVADGHGGEQV